MRFRLLYEDEDVRLGVGDHLIGRAEDCSVQLDDPLVSRHHALLQVSEGKLEIRDLNSRNGVEVNGNRISGGVSLEHGDRIRVGSAELSVATGTSPRANATTVRQQLAPPHEVLGLLGGLADKALALGNAAEAERILRQHLEKTLEELRSGRRLDATFTERACRHALALARELPHGRWFSYVFQLAASAQLRLPADLVEGLYETAQRQKLPDLTAVDAYIQQQRGELHAMNPRERFVLGRIEGLRRSLQSR